MPSASSSRVGSRPTPRERLAGASAGRTSQHAVPHAPFALHAACQAVMGANSAPTHSLVGKLRALLARASSCWPARCAKDAPPHTRPGGRCWWTKPRTSQHVLGHVACARSPCLPSSAAIGCARRVVAHAQPRRLLHTATHRGE
ncbi:hypothetical protein EK21DRAFT_85149 [Setomelanomma holmii]|uniref:Uncharacterized protein n=1 Tax=Setomelanomma holmii TaxID=210430 RepID=A0A9P4HIJ0_9PLEO|nr:hypothetical protein EK21DRAFT_85149 [Setomelanomma holmii]